MEAEFNQLNHATWECKYHVVFEREEFDMDRAECRTQDAEFSGPQILGTGVLCHDRWPGRGSDPGLHQKPRTSRSAIGAV
jgi:hypothetical protein